MKEGYPALSDTFTAGPSESCLMPRCMTGPRCSHYPPGPMTMPQNGFPVPVAPACVPAGPCLPDAEVGLILTEFHGAPVPLGSFLPPRSGTIQ